MAGVLTFILRTRGACDGPLCAGELGETHVNRLAIGHHSPLRWCAAK